jgi:RNA polymerase sigma-70 factor, ECF subfamily
MKGVEIAAHGTTTLEPEARAGFQPLTAEAICADFADQVYRFAIILATAEDAADDLAQEALLRAIKKRRQYRPERGSPQSWLWRIVANVAADAARGRARRRALFGKLFQQWRTDRLPQDPESQALALEESQVVRDRLRRLPERDRRLLALRFGADLDLTSVGASLGISAAAAGVGIQRALARLRDLMEENHD